MIINDLPRQAAMEVDFPVRSPSENSGRRSGIFRGEGPPGMTAVPTADSNGVSKSLAVGALGDVAILERLKGDFTFRDTEGQTLQATERLKPWKAVLGGTVYEALADS